jgi:hypothetical protein
VNNEFLHVIVTCHNASLTGKKVKTNLLHITFHHSEGSNIKRVFPQSLGESYLYIEALRRVQKLTHRD